MRADSWNFEVVTSELEAKADAALAELAELADVRLKELAAKDEEIATLKAALASLNLPVSDDDLARVFASLDADGSGVLELSEFLNAIHAEPPAEEAQWLRLGIGIAATAYGGVLLSLNSIGLTYGTHTIPTSAVVTIVVIWLVVVVPLTLGGTILGRQWGGASDWPCCDGSTAKPRNPRHFDTIEGGRVHQTLLGTIQYVKAIYSTKTTVSDTFWRPGGV